MHPLEKMLIVMLLVQLMHLGITAAMADRGTKAITAGLALFILWLIVRLVFGFHEVMGII